MAISPRQLVFYIRAENQATRVFQNFSRDFKSMATSADLQGRMRLFDTRQQAASLRMTNQIERAWNSAAYSAQRYQRALDAVDKRSRTMWSAVAPAGTIYGGIRPVGTQMGTLSGLNQRQTIQQLGLLKRSADISKRNAIAVEQASAAQAEALAMQKAQIQRMIDLQPWEQMSRTANTVHQLGRELQLLGVVGTAALGYAAYAAKNLQTNLQLAATQARPVNAGMEATNRISADLMDKTLGLMKQFPASAQDMADSYYQIFSGTNIQNTQQATDLLALINKMAVAGGTDLKTMTDAALTLGNTWGSSLPEMTDMANQFFAAVRYGRTNATQFANSLVNIVPAAQSAGLAFSDISNAMAVLTRLAGPRAEPRMMTGLARMIERFADPQFRAGLQQLYGISTIDPQTGKMRPLLEILDQIKRLVVDTGKVKPGAALLNFFKEVSSAAGAQQGTTGYIQARRTFQYLIMHMSEYRTVAGLITRDNDELEQSFLAMSKAPGFRWGLFTNQLKVMAYTIGNAVIPVLIQMFGWVGRVVSWFNNLDESTKRYIARLAAFVTIGSLAVGTAIAWTTSLANLYFILKMLQIVTAGKGGIMASFVTSAAATRVRLFAAALLLVSYILIKQPQILKQAAKAFEELARGLYAVREILLSMATIALVAYFGRLAGVSGLAASNFTRVSNGAYRLRSSLGTFVRGASQAEVRLARISKVLMFLFPLMSTGVLAFAVFAALAQKLGPIQTALDGIASAAGGLGNAFAIITSGLLARRLLQTAVAAKILGVAATGWWGVAIMAAIALITYLILNWDKVMKWWRRFWLIMVNIFKMAWALIKGAVNLGIYYMLLGFLLLAKGIDKIFGGWVPGVHKAMQAAENFINGFKDRAIRDFKEVARVAGKITQTPTGGVNMWAEKMAKTEGFKSFVSHQVEVMKVLSNYSTESGMAFLSVLSDLRAQAEQGSKAAKAVIDELLALGLISQGMEVMPKWPRNGPQQVSDMAKGLYDAAVAEAKFLEGLRALGPVYAKMMGTNVGDTKTYLRNYQDYLQKRKQLEKMGFPVEIIDQWLQYYIDLHKKHWSDAVFQMQLARLVTLYHRKELTGRIDDIRAYVALRKKIEANTDEAQQEVMDRSLNNNEKAWVSQAAFFAKVQQLQADQAAIAAAKTSDAWYAASVKYQQDMKVVNDNWNNDQAGLVQEALNRTNKAGIPMAQFWKRLGRVQILSQQYAAVQGTKKGYAAWVKYQDALDALQKDSSERQQGYIQEFLNKTNTSIDDVINNVKGMYDELYQRNQGFLQIFQGPFATGPVGQIFSQWNIPLGNKNVLSDIEAQITNMDTWTGMLQTLKNRGLPDLFMSQIMQLDPNDPMVRANVDQLTKMSGPDWERLRAAAKKGQATIDKLTLWQFEQQLKHYKTFGAKIAEQIVKGFRDASLTPALQNTIRSSLLRLFPGMAKSLGINVPLPKTPTAKEPTRTTQSVTNNQHTHITVAKDDVQTMTTALKHHYWSQRVLN